MLRKRIAPALAFLVIVTALSCRGREPAAGDTARDTVVAPRPPESPAPWVAELGSLLVVPSDSENTGVILFPVTPRSKQISASELSLLSASGDAAHARAALVVSDSQVCGEAPMVQVRSADSTPW